MTHKNPKSRTKDSQATSQPDGKKLPDSAFAFKKFIALPQGLKVKSGDNPDPTNPRRPLPVKAVPLNSFHSSNDTQQIGVSTTYVPSQVEPSEIIGSAGSVVSRGRSRRSSVSSTGSTGTPNGSISSIPSEVSYTPRYRKRPSSTPPDIGRQRASPVDRRIGKVVNQYYTDLINSLNNNNNDPYTDGNTWSQDGDDLGFYTVDQGDDPLVYSVGYSGNPGTDLSHYPGTEPGHPRTYPEDRYTHNHEDAYLGSGDNTKVVENWQLHPSTNKSDHLTSPGHESVMHPHYVTLPRGGQVIHHRQPLQQVQSMRPAMAHTNGTLSRGGGMVVYRPTPGSKDMLIVSNGHANHSEIHSAQGNLYKSKAMSSSMPTLLDGNKKADKKFLKELKKREKEERKRLEKEEKRRIKEEKKLQKALKKAHSRTLPRSFGSYVNKPIESVYSRPKLSLSAVPIDYEDNPSRPQRVSAPAPTHSPPPPPPEPSMRTRSLYSSAPDLLRLEQVYGATIRGHHQHSKQPAPRPRSSINQGIYTVSSYSARTVVLQRGPEGYGFVLRGAKSQTNATGELDFCPTAEFPALQYLDSVDPGSRSDRAGLKSGDFLLEINGENVVRASHDRVVQLIRQAGDTLAMKVVTVQRQETADQWLQHQDGSMTLPVRGGKKAAPQPPQRNPHTSISLTKTQGKQIAEGMAEIENDTEMESPKRVINRAGTKKKSVPAPLPPDQLDKVLAENDKQEVMSQEQKTASIRSSHSAKRVSCIELGGLENGGVHASEKYMSPSEMRIKKYHQKKSGSVINMERSRSTSDLLDGRNKEPVYATPVAVPSVGNKHKRSASGSGDIVDKYDYDGGDNVSLKSASSYGGSTGNLKSATNERPKAPPPPPPGGSNVPKRQAPAPPKNVEPVRPAKTELVTISTNKKVYATTTEIKSSQVGDQSDQSSFKPPNQVKVTDEPKIKIKSTVAVTASHQRNASSVSKRSDSSHEDSAEKHSVSFAEDRVNDNAQKFLQKHPNAQLLVTADVHTRKKKLSEPEPDYDVDSDGENDKARNSVTVISVGEKKTKTESTKQLTIKRTDIPSSAVTKKQEDVQIPPPPREPAPKPPTKSQAPPSPKTSSSPSTKAPSPAPSPARQVSPAPQASPARQPSPVRPATPPKEVVEEAKEDNEELPVFAPPPPAPPAPPPPPPPIANPEPAPSPKTGPRQTGDGPTTSLLPTGDIMAAVQKRRARMETEGPKVTPLTQKKPDPSDNQAAIIAAVAKRRQHLEQKSDTDVLDQIESKLHKTKKLQSAKLFFSSDNVGKKSETKEVPKPKTTPVVSKTTTSTTSKVSSTVTPKVETKVTPKVEAKVTPKVETKVTNKVETKPEIVNKTPTTTAPMKPLFDSNTVGKVTENKKPVTKQKSVESDKPTTTDFLAMAEKARQDWLKKKASSSSLSSGSPTHTTATTTRAKSEPPKTTGKEVNTGKPTSPTQLTITTSNPDKPKINGVVRKTSTTSTPLKTSRDTDLISRTTSIRDRIASFEKNKKLEVSNGKAHTTSPKSPHYKVQGVTTDSSATDKTGTLPPPPEFGDVVQVDIIPPPSGYKHEDTDSVVSSVSTLSTLSDEHADSGYSLSKKNSYEDLIPPPPPGFDDNTDQGYDEMPAVIPPPPDFESNKNNNVIVKPVRTNKPFLSKAVDTWQCLDVLDWLDSLNMTSYKPSFQEHCIDGKKLAGLTRNDYIELGVTQVGHRMNLERSIKKAAMRSGSLS
ncbi:SH3 and multiple ankyrin repeat domains protein 2-like isoform X9 [Argopecten irradians]|uniref:SH3 and multiple ankyrin repeat domains protein 2-like isoform X9 n=1 Tax=Argopecten irradians TaxID=31199 RepID=UPI0037188428